MTSVDSLPYELLQNIFSLALESFGTLNDTGLDYIARYWERDRTMFLTTITSVCCRWRNIAVSASSLWRTITLVSTIVREGRGALAILHRLKEFLRGSGDTSLDMFILIYQDVAEPIIWVLLAHVQRCRTFCLVSNRQIRNISLLPLPGAMSNLTSLDITIIEPQDKSYFTNILGKDNVAPLRDLRLNLQYRWEEDMAQTLSLLGLLECVHTGDLHRLSFIGPPDTWNELAIYLARCPRAQIMNIMMQHHRQYLDAYAPPTFTLPNLEVVGLAILLDMRVRALTWTPNEEHLEVYTEEAFKRGRFAAEPSNDDRLRVNSEEHTHPLLLRTLSLYGINYNVSVPERIDEWCTFFEHYPSISTLQLIGCRHISSMLSGLASGRVNLPLLTQLVIIGKDSVIWDDYHDDKTFPGALRRLVGRYEGLTVQCSSQEVFKGTAMSGFAVEQFKEELGARVNWDYV